MEARDEPSRDSAVTPDGLVHEEGLVRFIVSAWRPRFRESLANERRREKLVRGFNHFGHLDPRFAERIPREHQNAEFLLSVLGRFGAPNRCHLMSSHSRLDRRELPLKDALELVLAHEHGTFVSCIPGRLAYFHDEELGNRNLLRRHD